MTTTTFTPSTTVTSTDAKAAKAAKHAGRVSWTNGLATSVAAAVVVTGVAAAFQGAGHGLAVGDGAIPLMGFAQMVLLFAVIGIVLARHTSRSTFYKVTVVLTALSCLPDLALGQGVVSKVGLMTTHVVAAAIIVPRLARREQ